MTLRFFLLYIRSLQLWIIIEIAWTIMIDRLRMTRIATRAIRGHPQAYRVSASYTRPENGIRQ